MFLRKTNLWFSGLASAPVHEFWLSVLLLLLFIDLNDPCAENKLTVY